MATHTHGTSGFGLAAFSIPRFSRSTEQSITRNEITRSVRIEIITSLAHELWSHTQFPTSAEYTAVCQMLVSRHPSLKDTIGNGYVSVQSLNKFAV